MNGLDGNINWSVLSFPGTLRFLSSSPKYGRTKAIRNLLFAEVPSLVVSHVSLGAEALSAVLGAGEGPLVLVDAHVDL